MPVTYNRFPVIIAELPAKVDSAVATGALAVAAHARARVPVGAPDVHLRDAIHVEREGVAEYSVVAGDNEVWYGHLVEFGTTHSAPRPFMVPAAGDGRDEVVGLVAAALRSL